MLLVMDFPVEDSSLEDLRRFIRYWYLVRDKGKLLSAVLDSTLLVLGCGVGLGS